MSEFTAKKLGEVLAFCRLGQQTIDQGKALVETIEPGIIASYRSQLKDLEDELVKNAGTTTLTKAEKTEAKLAGMRDAYIGDEWDNAAEIMEWLGFFEGAAIVHWSLIKGVSDAQDDTELRGLSDRALKLHRQFLDEVTAELKRIGSQRAQS